VIGKAALTLRGREAGVQPADPGGHRGRADVQRSRAQGRQLRPAGSLVLAPRNLFSRWRAFTEQCTGTERRLKRLTTSFGCQSVATATALTHDTATGKPITPGQCRIPVGIGSPLWRVDCASTKFVSRPRSCLPGTRASTRLPLTRLRPTGRGRSRRSERTTAPTRFLPPAPIGGFAWVRPPSRRWPRS
jgi:hypothetical protein